MQSGWKGGQAVFIYLTALHNVGIFFPLPASRVTRGGRFTSSLTTYIFPLSVTNHISPRLELHCDQSRVLHWLIEF